MSQNKLKKNPSRETCESIIRRILNAEIGQRGKNEHFRQAADFMPYFESLYPASDSLTKQVQRAVKTLNLPKDEHGYFIINKSSRQLSQDQELKRLFQMSEAVSHDLSACETLFLEMQNSYKDYLMNLIAESETFDGTYITMTKTNNGILFYTTQKIQLLKLLEQFACNTSCESSFSDTENVP